MHDNDLKEKAEFLSSAQAYLDQSLYMEALDLAEAWLKLHSMDADANIVSCHALTKMGKLEQVDELLGRVDDQILRLSKIFMVMGDICLEGGLTTEAVRFYRKFIAMNPESKDAKKLSGKIPALTSDPLEPSHEMEEEHYEEVSRIAPDFYTVTLADLYIKQGYLQMAADVLGEILNIDSDNHVASRKLGDVNTMLRNKKHNEEVVQELTHWLKNIDRIRSYAS
jgi:tetratricopeptide (TPR) repeat protein